MMYTSFQFSNKLQKLLTVIILVKLIHLCLGFIDWTQRDNKGMEFWQYFKKKYMLQQLLSVPCTVFRRVLIPKHMQQVR